MVDRNSRSSVHSAKRRQRTFYPNAGHPAPGVYTIDHTTNTRRLACVLRLLASSITNAQRFVQGARHLGETRQVYLSELLDFIIQRPHYADGGLRCKRQSKTHERPRRHAPRRARAPLRRPRLIPSPPLWRLRRTRRARRAPSRRAPSSGVSHAVTPMAPRKAVRWAPPMCRAAPPISRATNPVIGRMGITARWAMAHRPRSPCRA